MADQLNRDEVLAKIEKARDTVAALCTGEKNWTMSVPARRDTDPDLVIADALASAAALLSVAQADQTWNEAIKAAKEEADAAQWEYGIDSTAGMAADRIGALARPSQAQAESQDYSALKDDIEWAEQVISSSQAQEPRKPCGTCGGSRVDPGGLPVCRDCAEPSVSGAVDEPSEEATAWEKFKGIYGENAQRHPNDDWRGFRRGWQCRAALSQSPAQVTLDESEAFKQFAATTDLTVEEVMFHKMTWTLACEWQRLALSRAQQQPAAHDGPWHEAVLHECMRVESCYVKDNPKQTLLNLINWHCQAERDLQPAAQTAVPEGWQLVPVEPVTEMVMAARARGTNATKAEYWAAMISAAPQPVAAQVGDELNALYREYYEADRAYTKLHDQISPGLTTVTDEHYKALADTSKRFCKVRDTLAGHLQPTPSDDRNLLLRGGDQFAGQGQQSGGKDA